MDGRWISHRDWYIIEKKLQKLEALEDAGVSLWEHYPKGIMDDEMYANVPDNKKDDEID